MICDDHQRIGPVTLLMESERPSRVPPAPIVTIRTFPTQADIEQAMTVALTPVWQELQAMRRTLHIVAGEQKELRRLLTAVLEYQRRPGFWGRLWLRLTMP